MKCHWNQQDLIVIGLLIRILEGNPLFTIDTDSFDQNVLYLSIYRAHNIMFQEVEDLEETTLPIPEDDESTPHVWQLCHKTTQLSDCFVAALKSSPHATAR